LKWRKRPQADNQRINVSGHNIDPIWKNLDMGILTALIIRDINGLHFGHLDTPTKQAPRYETIYD
jgi:hypothetical protein